MKINFTTKANDGAWVCFLQAKGKFPLSEKEKAILRSRATFAKALAKSGLIKTDKPDVHNLLEPRLGPSQQTRTIPFLKLLQRFWKAYY